MEVLGRQTLTLTLTLALTLTLTLALCNPSPSPNPNPNPSPSPSPSPSPEQIGFIDEGMCRERLPAPSEHTYIFMCGPPPMLKFACRPNLDKLGHAEDHVLAF